MKRVLVFSLLAFLLLASVTACSQARQNSLLVGQAAQVDSQGIAKQGENLVPVAAIVKATKANLRQEASPWAKVLKPVEQGDLLSLNSSTPVGPWFRVKVSNTDEAWIHGNANRGRNHSTSEE